MFSWFAGYIDVVAWNYLEQIKQAFLETYSKVYLGNMTNSLKTLQADTLDTENAQALWIRIIYLCSPLKDMSLKYFG